MATIGDLIELTMDLPAKKLSAGARGTIVHNHSDQAYEIEFANVKGETLELLALRPEQFIVVWRAETKEWVSVEEQAAALIAHLPDEAAREVLDFARFLSARHQPSTN